MAGGPIFPNSFYPNPTTAGDLFPNFHTGGTNSQRDEGIGLAASISADATAELRFQMPPTLPSGTGKLRVLSLANATSGTVVFDPQWASVAAGENPDTVTLNAEGNTTTTWASGDNDDYKETKITLDADTLTAGETVVMSLVFDSTSTIAAVSTHIVSIIWE